MTTTAQRGKHVVAVSEIAGLSGRSRQRAWQLTARPDFPAPYDVLATGKVWRRTTVVRWLADHGMLAHPADR